MVPHVPQDETRKRGAKRDIQGKVRTPDIFLDLSGDIGLPIPYVQIVVIVMSANKSKKSVQETVADLDLLHDVWLQHGKPLEEKAASLNRTRIPVYGQRMRARVNRFVRQWEPASPLSRTAACC